MRISDWSSDVCSSDLREALFAARPVGDVAHRVDRLVRRARGDQDTAAEQRAMVGGREVGLAGERHDGGSVCERSEEHTSELQSLMRISYAVFCLKKKRENKRKNIRSKRLM